MRVFSEAKLDRKNIVFVGTKRQAAEIVAEQAKRCGVNYVNRRWLGGLLTNFETVRMRISRLRQLEEMYAVGDVHRRPKKEQSVLNREYWKLDKTLGGLKNIRGRPEVLFIVDRKREEIAVQESIKVGAVVAALVDTNCNPDGIQFVIPGNDDSIRSVKLITSAVADAILGSEPGEPDDDDDPELHPSGVPRIPLPVVGEDEIELPLPDWDEDDE